MATLGHEQDALTRTDALHAAYVANAARIVVFLIGTLEKARAGRTSLATLFAALTGMLLLSGRVPAHFGPACWLACIT
jgi:hypothetical protein